MLRPTKSNWNDSSITWIKTRECLGDSTEVEVLADEQQAEIRSAWSFRRLDKIQPLPPLDVA